MDSSSKHIAWNEILSCVLGESTSMKIWNIKTRKNHVKKIGLKICVQQCFPRSQTCVLYFADIWNIKVQNIKIWKYKV